MVVLNVYFVVIYCKYLLKTYVSNKRVKFFINVYSINIICLCSILFLVQMLPDFLLKSLSIR